MNYIGIKTVNAEPMTVNEALQKGYRTSDNTGDGYEVTYDDGYKSWCPKDVFEKHNFEIKNSELASTCAMMVSSDYKERFKAEYIQLANRYKGLRRMIDRWDANQLDFTPTCSRQLYNEQIKAMFLYIDVLNIRAEVECINLGEYKIETNLGSQACSH